MNRPPSQQLRQGITCIDARYVDWGMACFYLVEQGEACALIETGTRHSIPALLAVLAERGIQPEQIRYIMPTHVHLDHAGGAGAMMRVFPAAQLVVHPRGARHMADPSRLVAASLAVYGEALFADLYGEIEAVDPGRTVVASDGHRLMLGDRALEIRHTEGHARHHYCVWDELSCGWFTGDMFGVCYPWFRFPEGDYLLPSTTPTQFDPAAYLRSLALLDSYAPSHMYLTHYGAIEYTAAKRAQLATQVEAYSHLARCAAERGSLLAADLADYALQRLRGFTRSADDEQLQQWLSFDLDLNAQGLAHWLQSQEQ